MPPLRQDTPTCRNAAAVDHSGFDIRTMNLSAGGSVWPADIFHVLGNINRSGLGMLPENSYRIQSSVEPEHSTRALWIWSEYQENTLFP